MQQKEQRTIFVGVSGGVDSSVSAALLKEQNYDVVGVFIRTWQPDWTPCTWRDERRDAMRVCAHLDIPFMELDLEKEYKEGVADYMIAEYRAGRTPNPDVMCNREVKFGGFLKWALEHGADAVATGHYAQNIFNTKTNLWELHRGIDASKDQSYFLWTLTQEQLQHLVFPVGNMSKDQTRKIAEKFKLPTATKKDSQGICFIGDVDMKDFLKHYINEQPGDVLNEQGDSIGHHRGALFFTLGERHGFTITQKGIDDNPRYVIEKDIEKNTITVSQNPEEVSGTRTFQLQDVVWRGPQPRPNDRYIAQIRYHGVYKKVQIRDMQKNTAEITFEKSDTTIAPGQSVVFYQGTHCVGGGVVV